MTKKTTYIILFTAIIAVAGLYFYNKYNVAPQIEISKLEIIDQDTVRFDFNTLKGKKVIVSFYASWCPNCIEELKLLNKVKPIKLANVEVVAVTDESLTELSTFKDQKGYPFTFLKLNNAFGNIGIASIPTTYLLNTKGEIVYNKVGYIDWEDESTINHLLSIME
jgi:peroxiredoxin